MSSLFLEDIRYHTSSNKEIQFLICQSCFWCASSYTSMVDDLNTTRIVNCPLCKDSKLESIPISEKEEYKVDYNPKTGVILEFQK